METKPPPGRKETIRKIALALMNTWVMLGGPRNCRFSAIADTHRFTDKDVIKNPNLLIHLESTALYLDRLRIEGRLMEVFDGTFPKS